MRFLTATFVLFAVLTTGLISYCDKDRGNTPKDTIKGIEDRDNTPKNAVKGMMDAVKAKDYEKAVSYIDIEGICREIKLQFEKMAKDMPEEEKKKLEESMPAEMMDMMDPQKFKEKMIEQMKEDEDIKDFEYEITDVSDEKDGVVTVTVKLTPKNGEPDEETFPVKKVGGVWKVSIPGMD